MIAISSSIGLTVILLAVWGYVIYTLYSNGTSVTLVAIYGGVGAFVIVLVFGVLLFLALWTKLWPGDNVQDVTDASEAVANVSKA